MNSTAISALILEHTDKQILNLDTRQMQQTLLKGNDLKFSVLLIVSDKEVMKCITIATIVLLQISFISCHQIPRQTKGNSNVKNNNGIVFLLSSFPTMSLTLIVAVKCDCTP